MQNTTDQKTTTTLRILYPLWVLIGILSIMYIPSTLIDHDSAASTMDNIASNELLFRIGIVGRIIVQLLYILIPLLLYNLLKDINKNQALLMLVLAFMSIPVTLYNETNQLAVLSFLEQPDIAMNYLDAYYRGLHIAIIFWGLWLFPLGQLVYKSPYFPKIMGVFLILGGIGYLLGAFIDLLFPEATLLKTILEYLTFGEMIFIIWLVFRGIKTTHHKELS